jgi:RNA polymerase sigma-70 factor, ECF subfamily
MTESGGESSGEVDLIEAVYHDLFIVAYRVAHRILGDACEAEDAAAEALARAVVHWPRVGRMSYRSAWVARVASNVAIDRVRRQGRPTPAERPRAADLSETAVLRLALAQALSSLPRRQREVVALRYLADLPEAEVASTLGLSRNTVKKHTSRAIASLRLTLGPSWKDLDLVSDR